MPKIKTKTKRKTHLSWNFWIRLALGVILIVIGAFTYFKIFMSKSPGYPPTNGLCRNQCINEEANCKHKCYNEFDTPCIADCDYKSINCESKCPSLIDDYNCSKPCEDALIKCEDVCEHLPDESFASKWRECYDKCRQDSSQCEGACR